jgi:hypothetical protein
MLLVEDKHVISLALHGSVEDRGVPICMNFLTLFSLFLYSSVYRGNKYEGRCVMGCCAI